jgi:hypothetical protein
MVGDEVHSVRLTAGREIRNKVLSTHIIASEYRAWPSL